MLADDPKHSDEQEQANVITYTVVLVDHVDSGVPSCFTLTVHATSAVEARTLAEIRQPKALVAGVFRGVHTELLSTYPGENRFLGLIVNAAQG